MLAPMNRNLSNSKMQQLFHVVSEFEIPVPFDIVLIRIRDTSSDNNYDNTRVIRVGLQEARVDQNFRLLEPRLANIT